MERPQYITRVVLAIITFLLSMQFGFSQSTTYRDSIYKAYSRGKMDKWYDLMHTCEKNVDQNNLEMSNLS